MEAAFPVEKGLYRLGPSNQSLEASIVKIVLRFSPGLELVVQLFGRPFPPISSDARLPLQRSYLVRYQRSDSIDENPPHGGTALLEDGYERKSWACWKGFTGDATGDG